MRLRDWRAQEDLSPKEMAALIDVATNSYYRYELAPTARDFRLPLSEIMLNIVRVTGGAVLPNDFYDLDSVLRRDADVAA